MTINFIKSLVMISMFMIYIVGLVNVNDYKVYSLNTAELDKLFQNLTPDYLRSKDFNINGGGNLLENTSNLSNILS